MSVKQNWNDVTDERKLEETWVVEIRVELVTAIKGNAVEDDDDDDDDGDDADDDDDDDDDDDEESNSVRLHTAHDRFRFLRRSSFIQSEVLSQKLFGSNLCEDGSV